MAQRIARKHPDRAEELAEWLETAHQRLVFTARVDQSRRGRVDTRSLVWDVSVMTSEGPAPPVSIRARDLCDAHGHPIDARGDAPLLLWQLGIGIPDTPKAWNDA